jgi:serine/threonine protein phosphatase PrpC
MGVCDGHGIFGQDISSYLVNNLPQNLNNEFINKNIKNLSMEKLSTLNPILESTFKQTNINLNTDERIDSTFSGSTCVTALFTPTRLICINVGDSRCIMGKLNNNKWISKNLTRDHKPSEPDEMDRIIAAGGYVEPYRDNDGNFVGPERVWKKEEDGPGLAMSRSFGDEIAHCVGVIVNPEINEYQFLNEDKFFILASDGLWEFISSEEVVNIVKDFYLENDIEGAITYLYKEASKRWIMEEEVIDDITIILVFLN